MSITFSESNIKEAYLQFKLAQNLSCDPEENQCNYKVNLVYGSDVTDACCYRMWVYNMPKGTLTKPQNAWL